MIGVVATLRVQPDKAQAFEAGFADLAAKVKANEPGNLLYQLAKSRKEPGVYKVMELYRDQEALTAHGQTEYFKQIGATVIGPALAAPPEIEYLDTVD